MGNLLEFNKLASGLGLALEGRRTGELKKGDLMRPTNLAQSQWNLHLRIFAFWLGGVMVLATGSSAQCLQAIDSTGDTGAEFDDFTEHTYSEAAGPIGTFADCTVTRKFAKPIESLTLTIVAGRADDIGFIGNLQVTNTVPSCSDVSTVVAPVDVTNEVTVDGDTAMLVLRAQENCCCTTGWGLATRPDRANARLHWEVKLESREVKLKKQGKTKIEDDNHYAENTKLRATVVFPPGHPKAGKVDKDFNEMVTFTEEEGTTYYDGANGATLLPQTVQAESGVAEIELKSVSNSNDVTGPLDARIRAEGPGLAPQEATNPLSVDQWVDENRNGFIDWLDKQTGAIHDCALKQGGEAKTVQEHVSDIRQDSNGGCGETPLEVVNRSPIQVSPVCGTPNQHRLNEGGQLTASVLHEARHAWQNAERDRNVGTDDFRDSLEPTPKNDDDWDYFLEIVSLPSALLITEAANGTGDWNPDPGGFDLGWQTDAENHGYLFRRVCP